MPRRTLTLLMALALGCAAGCGGGESAPQAAAPQVGASGTVPSDPAARVVWEFFDAVRQGRAADANRCLTPLSLQRITEQEMNITPPGSTTARFQVGEVKARQNDHSLVELTWTDLDADGNPYDDHILCELRVCDGQWRICGMAQDQGPGVEPMVLDFESPQGIGPRPPQVGQSPASATAAAPPAASDAASQAKELARDPFQQPVQR
jgi:hypothetical protein